MTKIKTLGLTIVGSRGCINLAIGSRAARVVLLACSLLLAVCTPSSADDNQVDIEAELTACASPCVTLPGAEGDFEYRAEILNDGTTVKEVRFHAIVTIPVPNPLEITKINAGAAGLVTIDLTRPNPLNQLAQTYATCTMVLRRAGATYLTYELSLAAKLKNGQFVGRKKSRGFCESGLMTAKAQIAIPALQHGDIAFISVDRVDILSSLPRSPGDACEGCWDY
jgi:hypothetical protein